jgi:hypothetical protein
MQTQGYIDCRYFFQNSLQPLHTNGSSKNLSSIVNVSIIKARRDSLSPRVAEHRAEVVPHQGKHPLPERGRDVAGPVAVQAAVPVAPLALALAAQGFEDWQLIGLGHFTHRKPHFSGLFAT